MCGIDEAIRLHDKVVLLLSEAAVTSHWVAYEVNLATTREAREGRTVLYPLRLDDAVLTTSQGWPRRCATGDILAISGSGPSMPPITPCLGGCCGI